MERALELEEDTTALRLRGAIHALEGEWDEAERSLTRARALSPKDPETLAWLAAVSYTHLTLPTICSV